MNNRKQFRKKCKELLGENYKDIKLGSFTEEQKDNILLFLYMLKKIRGTTEISTLSAWKE